MRHNWMSGALLSMVLGLPAAALGAPDYAAPAVGCLECHGPFFLNFEYVSLKDGTPWNVSLMDGHINMGVDCMWCHLDFPGSTPVLTNRSGDVVHNRGCIGCHGRSDDETGICTFDQPDDGTLHCGSGAGLRQHHFNSGTFLCANCHANDTDSLVFTPVGENNPSIFNGLDGCADAVFGPTGLDNDGDGLDDGADPDCGDCLPDLNDDGVVNAADLALLLGAWGMGPGNPADFTGDGFVNAADLALLLGAWGPCP